jgi:hypothetical protein
MNNDILIFKNLRLFNDSVIPEDKKTWFSENVFAQKNTISKKAG